MRTYSLRVVSSATRSCLWAAALTATFACAPDDAAPESGPVASRFTPTGEIHLKETDDVLTVAPRITVDHLGGFLVTDEKEAQVRRYAQDGQLLWHFGRKGQGPGEFDYPLSAHRLPDRSILVFDTYKRAARLDSSGTRVIRTYTTAFGPLYHTRVLDDSLVIVAGRRESIAGPRLHIWNYQNERLVRSFFTPVVPDRTHEMAGALAGFLSTAMRGDTLAVLYSLSDTIYLYHKDGTLQSKIKVPYRGFRPLTVEAPTPGTPAKEAAKWMESFSLGSDLFWEPNGDFVIQYQDRVAMDQAWHLLRMQRSGEWLWEHQNTPRILTIDERDRTVYSLAQDAPLPNRWRVAKWAE